MSEKFKEIKESLIKSNETPLSNVTEHGDEKGKRKHEDSTSNMAKKRANIRERQPNSSKNKEERFPKRKVAVCVGYCGTGYHGMQLNPPHKTIEGDIFSAFVKAGAISKDNSNDPKKSSFLRAARTDKGVHAAGNVISLKLIIEDPNIVEKINSHLPETIRVWGYFRTNKSFECRKMCNSRIYEYLMPTYAFLPSRPDSTFAKRLLEISENMKQTFDRDEEGENFWKLTEKTLEENGISREDISQCRQIEQKEFEARAEGKPEEEIKKSSKDKMDLIKKVKSIENAARRSYRASSDRMERIRQAFSLYQGVHNFHNYTLGKSANDKSASRIIKDLHVSDPFLIDGTEWLSIKIHGQSFMLHQIRKMVAMACLVVRSHCPSVRITESFGPIKINIPKAPSLGLLLERPVYDGFNQRLNKLGHESINFDKWDNEIEKFKQKFIYDKIYVEEKKENVFNGFFGFIDSYQGGTMLDYLTPKGIVKNETEYEKKLDDDDEDDETANDENDS